MYDIIIYHHVLDSHKMRDVRVVLPGDVIIETPQTESDRLVRQLFYFDPINCFIVNIILLSISCYCRYHIIVNINCFISLLILDSQEPQW